MVYTLQHKSLGLLLWLLVVACAATAQNSKVNRFAAGLSAGVNFPQMSVKGNPGVDVRANLLYVPIPLIGLMPEVSYGTLAGNGLLNTPRPELFVAGEQLSFSTTYFYYGLSAALNLQRVFSVRKPRGRMIPYLTAGAGYMNASASREVVATGVTAGYDFRLYTNHIGMLLRINMNRAFDLTLSGRYNITQTYYLDAIPLKDRFDSFIGLHIGLSYKFGSSNLKSDFIDWRNVNRAGGRGGAGSGRCPRFF
jgi:hypothetical protein